MIALAVAYSKNRVMGNLGRIPWKIPGEQKKFKELTTGNIVVMGRRTYEEIGKPLPNRITYLISSTEVSNQENLRVAASLQEVIEQAGELDIFVAGGAKLYEEAIDLVDKMYITLIDKEYEGDTFFPEFKEEDFVITSQERQEGEIPYTYLTYERIKKKDGRA